MRVLITLESFSQKSVGKKIAEEILFVIYFEVWSGARSLALRLITQHTTHFTTATSNRLQIIELYYQNAYSVKNIHYAFLPFYGQFNRATVAAIRAILTKFHSKFKLLDIKPPTRT